MSAKIVWQGKEFRGKIVKFSFEAGNEVQLFDYRSRNILKFDLLELDVFTSRERGARKKIDHLAFRNRYDRFCRLEIEEVLPLIGNSNTAVFNGIKVNLNSNRLHCLANNLTCQHCGIQGKFFAIERSIRRNSSHEYSDWHLNLYAVGKFDREVLMTADHVVPKSRGGVDNLSNLQTLCTICNRTKDNKLEEEIEHRKD
jgi:5-methylcytosine-specific restriction endonuclease McrA